ncbi:MAG: DUF2510 domain-containing protein [Microbacteriaceae bacterium]|nr:DUF2510 domain-containing protein [Microbacteriaceae bacterium]
MSNVIPGAGGGGLPDPNWYEDPQDPSKVRWWDGAGWTASVRDAVMVADEGALLNEQLRSMSQPLYGEVPLDGGIEFDAATASSLASLAADLGFSRPPVLHAASSTSLGALYADVKTPAPSTEPASKLGGLLGRRKAATAKPAEPTLLPTVQSLPDAAPAVPAKPAAARTAPVKSSPAKAAPAEEAPAGPRRGASTGIAGGLGAPAAGITPQPGPSAPAVVSPPSPAVAGAPGPVAVPVPPEPAYEPGPQPASPPEPVDTPEPEPVATAAPTPTAPAYAPAPASRPGGHRPGGHRPGGLRPGAVAMALTAPPTSSAPATTASPAFSAPPPSGAPRPTIVWVRPPREKVNGPAVASTVFGFLSILCNPLFVLSIVAWITGRIGLGRSRQKRVASWGIGLGVIGALLWGAITLFAVLHPVSFKIKWWDMPAAAMAVRLDAPGASDVGDFDLYRLAFEACERGDRAAGLARQAEEVRRTGGDPATLVPATESFVMDGVGFVERWGAVLIGRDAAEALLEDDRVDDPYAVVSQSADRVFAAVYDAICPGVPAELAEAGATASS